MDDALIVFVRYPEAGKVKTRLAQSVGAEAAARIYRDLVESNLKILLPLKEVGIEIVISFDPPQKEEAVKQWLSGPYRYLSQAGGDLGCRMCDAFETLFKEGGKKAILIGSDTLGLTPSLIRQGFQALQHSQVVMGPAKDGGYYLIGLSRPWPRLFENIPWSTSDVLRLTLERAKEEHLSCLLLDELEDLDKIENMRREK